MYWYNLGTTTLFRPTMSNKLYQAVVFRALLNPASLAINGSEVRSTDILRRRYLSSQPCARSVHHGLQKNETPCLV